MEYRCGSLQGQVRMVSIRKLAQLAGVSNTAVWRALHQQPKVSPEVRARIIALANEHHYHPNRLAEGFMTGKTHTVGLIVEHLSWQFDARLCDGVMHAAADDRAHVMIVNVTPGALPLSSLDQPVDRAACRRHHHRRWPPRHFGEIGTGDVES